MKFLFLLAAVVLAIVVFRFLRSSAKPSGRAGVATKRLSSAKAKGTAYHAVSVTCGPNACEQAQAMVGKRFLSGQISHFPLPECTSGNCQCKFVHYDDRRDAEGDKRAPTALRSDLYTASGNPERRSGGGRRKRDHSSFD